MGDAARLRQGSIVWIPFAPDPQGRNAKPQPRPFIIVSATADIVPASKIIGIAVTSTFRDDASDPTLVPMRWNARGSTETGFRRKCFAKVDWALAIDVNRDGTFAGEHHQTFVRKRELDQILLAISKLAGEDG